MNETGFFNQRRLGLFNGIRPFNDVWPEELENDDNSASTTGTAGTARLELGEDCSVRDSRSAVRPLHVDRTVLRRPGTLREVAEPAADEAGEEAATARTLGQGEEEGIPVDRRGEAGREAPREATGDAGRGGPANAGA